MRRSLLANSLYWKYVAIVQHVPPNERFKIAIPRRNMHHMPRRISALLQLSDAGNSETTLPTPGISKAGDTNSAAQILLLRMGLLQQSDATGMHVILPLLQRSLEKLTIIIDSLMQFSLGSQKITLPLLNPASWWIASGRDELYGAELISLQDRHRKRMILTPTHEEAVTKMLVNLFGERSPYKKLPIRVHQITSKYRDEPRPRSGLLRGREFLMKDLYIFDADIEQAKKSYNNVRHVYRHLFRRILSLSDFIECRGSAEKMGGISSHEFFMPAPYGVGEDTIYWCERGLKEAKYGDEDEREYAINKELLDDDADDKSTPRHRLCDKCISTNDGCDIEHCAHVHTTKAVELGHAFIIGDKYSRIFSANYTTPNGQVKPLIMSCYGIGVTRVLQAVLERSAAEQGTLKWPLLIAPFQICFIGPKSGSKEEKRGAAAVMNKFIDEIVEPVFDVTAGFYRTTSLDALSELHDIVLDDRAELSIGNRARQMQKLGIPLIVVFGRTSVAENGKEAQVELMSADSNYSPKLVPLDSLRDEVHQQMVRCRQWKLPFDVEKENKESLQEKANA